MSKKYTSIKFFDTTVGWEVEIEEQDIELIREFPDGTISIENMDGLWFETKEIKYIYANKEDNKMENTKAKNRAELERIAEYTGDLALTAMFWSMFEDLSLKQQKTYLKWAWEIKESECGK